MTTTTEICGKQSDHGYTCSLHKNHSQGTPTNPGTPHVALRFRNEDAARDVIEVWDEVLKTVITNKVLYYEHK